ncbi:DUF300-domain-containing protein [Clavulina sp. PMI_390]|nr:DUF300-domain-containing protein [Clavulina sp. PMI_390]
MPPVYAIISFFSYRYFRSYTYYSLIEVVYESITLSAFLLLLIQYVASTGARHSAEAALTRKDKQALAFPLCCWRFRPTKPAFMHTIKWSVLQYTIFRPAISIAGIVCQKYNVLCDSSWSYKYASVWLTSVDFVSISIALYGLILFYVLTKEDLAGKRPLAKFLCIKLIVMVTFYQSWIFTALQDKGVIHATQYWTATNVADGLSALTLCIEMVFFAIAMMWAYPTSEYRSMTTQPLGFWRAIIDSLNFSDFAVEIWSSFRFFFDYMRGKPGTRASHFKEKEGVPDFDSAFGLRQVESPDGGRPFINTQPQAGGYPPRRPNDVEQAYDSYPPNGRR